MVPGPARFSRLFATPAFPAGNGPDFVNAAVALGTDLAPEDILDRLHRIEAGAGRTRDRRWGERTLDLDLLAVGDLIRPDVATVERWRTLPLARQMEETPDRLLLPHPRLQDRSFVLVPLAEVAPAGWRHPISGLTVDEMLAALPPADLASVRPLE